MATSVSLSHSGFTTIDLNNQTAYYVDREGFIPPMTRVTWDEVANYNNTGNAQVNVNTKNLMPVTIPMWVKGTSLSDLNTKLSDLWALVLACTNASPGTFQVNSETSYSIVNSTLPEDLQRDTLYETGFWARFTLVLMARP